MPGTQVSFGQRIADLARLHPATIAITLARQDGSEDQLDFAALDRWANRVARLLAARGVGPASMVCIGIYNSLEHYAAPMPPGVSAPARSRSARACPISSFAASPNLSPNAW